SFRTAAAVTLVAVPLVVAGVETLVRLLRFLRRADATGPAGWLPAAAALGVGVLASTALSWHVASDPHVQARFETVSEAYRTWEVADLVSGTEFAMFEDLPRYVPQDGYVIA